MKSGADLEQARHAPVDNGGPWLGCVIRDRIFSSVDFPAPFDPMMPTVSPLLISNETSLSAQMTSPSVGILRKGRQVPEATEIGQRLATRDPAAARRGCRAASAWRRCDSASRADQRRGPCVASSCDVCKDRFLAHEIQRSCPQDDQCADASDRNEVPGHRHGSQQAGPEAFDHPHHRIQRIQVTKGGPE